MQLKGNNPGSGSCSLDTSLGRVRASVDPRAAAARAASRWLQKVRARAARARVPGPPKPAAHPTHACSTEAIPTPWNVPLLVACPRAVTACGACCVAIKLALCRLVMQSFGGVCASAGADSEGAHLANFEAFSKITPSPIGGTWWRGCPQLDTRV